MHWACLLAYVAGTAHQELRLQNEDLAAENAPAEPSGPG